MEDNSWHLDRDWWVVLIGTAVAAVALVLGLASMILSPAKVSAADPTSAGVVAFGTAGAYGSPHELNAPTNASPLR
jgi:hypothetical protein